MSTNRRNHKQIGIATVLTVGTPLLTVVTYLLAGPKAIEVVVLAFAVPVSLIICCWMVVSKARNEGENSGEKA